jgi:hypothetical protein
VSHEACEKELKEVLVSFWSSIDLWAPEIC